MLRHIILLNVISFFVHRVDSYSDEPQTYDYIELRTEYRDGNWTIHGLWPDKYDGSWPQYCNSSIKFNPNSLIPLKSRLSVYWPSYSKSPLQFYKHEFEKHGTCITYPKVHKSNFTCQHNYIDTEPIISTLTSHNLNQRFSFKCFRILFDLIYDFFFPIKLNSSNELDISTEWYFSTTLDLFSANNPNTNLQQAGISPGLHFPLLNAKKILNRVICNKRTGAIIASAVCFSPTFDPILCPYDSEDCTKSEVYI